MNFSAKTKFHQTNEKKSYFEFLRKKLRKLSNSEKYASEAS